MSGGDQAAGLRQWARRRETSPVEERADESVASSASIDAVPVSAPVVPAPRTPLVVVGLPSHSVAPVRTRLGEWAALERRWAATPESWEILPVRADTDLDAWRQRYARWALWVQSDADAFAAMYRTLRQLKEHGGPRRLLALHEPRLPRQGLLDNLQRAAASYLDIDLLLLAR
ncbi:hypothetical protein [Vreelandella malpeensis]|uniref:Uncharacterized protein n=1 Tax=Vreelandella malpeensis TaxID=1172368 RepID=A0ABS8DQI2_9GAMM|nr:hypothetical protein [Halomonas malpeensis]MCB8888484.1 hypothetical protein [Halomonas malpeensis]